MDTKAALAAVIGGQRLHSVPDAPLEEWLITIVWRCVGWRISKYPIETRKPLAASAFQSIFDMLIHDLPRFIEAIPCAALGTGNLIMGFRIDWRNYRDLARAADDHLARILHDSLSDSPERGSLTVKQPAANSPSTCG